MSIRIEATASKPAQSLSAAFELRADGDQGELRLNSPLGSRVAAARWSPTMAVLVTTRGEERFSDLDELSRVALGEALPLTALPDWVAGRPWAGATSRPGEAGFDQLGWQVLLGRRDEGRVEIRREMPPAVRVQILLDDPS